MGVTRGKEYYDRYGWTTSDTNLQTLPGTAPTEASLLTQWMTLEARRSSLVEWLGCLSVDGRIHGDFKHIGAWTGRMAHSNPNQANIFASFHGEVTNPVEESKAKYDTELRGLWSTDKILIGTDLDGAQLRILTHYMKDDDWLRAILTGDKKLKTDVHSLNQSSLGSVCKDRDTAKTFIYAWLLGAGTAKVAQILQCTNKQASTAVKQFVSSFPGLKKLKDFVIPMDAKRGYFTGLDGRKVLCDSEHLMLAGYLQNGESVIVKHWVERWKTEARAAGVWFNLVDIVHDETQTEVKTEEDAQELIRIQKEAIDWVSKDLELWCPMDIESKLGKNWAETH